MEGTGKWILGGVLGLLALVGLFASANAVDGTFYYGGMVVFVACVVAIFLLIHFGYNEVEARKAAERHHGGEAKA